MSQSNNDLVKPEIRLSMRIGDIVESLEDGTWYKAKIVKVIKPGDHVKIHYLGWKAKWDKEIKLTSPSVRYDKSREKTPKSQWKKGQKVMATFTDGQKYPAEIIAINASGTYQVKFYDGFKKSVTESGLQKFSEKANREAKLVADDLYGPKGQPQDEPESDDVEETESVTTSTRGSRRLSNAVKRDSETSSLKSGRSTPVHRRSRSTTPLSDISRVSSIASTASKTRKTPRRSIRTVPREISSGANDDNETEIDEIEIVEVGSIGGGAGGADAFSFDDEEPPVKVALKSLKQKNDGLGALLGEDGYGQMLHVFRQSEWHEAKIIPPTKKTDASPKKGRTVFVHYTGWSKQYDEWIKLDTATIKVVKVAKIEVKHSFKVDDSVLGTWSDKKYYPCQIVELIPTGYQVKFYDGFKKKLAFSHVKKGTELEKKRALEAAEAEFGMRNERKRKSIFKRDKQGGSQTDPDVKRMILGQKRPRPASLSSSPTSKSPTPPRPSTPKTATPKLDKPPEKRSRRSTRGNQVEKEDREEELPPPPKRVAEVKEKRERGRPRLSVTPKQTKPEPKVETVNKSPEVTNEGKKSEIDDLSEFERSIQERKRQIEEDERKVVEIKAKKKREQDIARLRPEQLAAYQNVMTKLSESECDSIVQGFLAAASPPTTINSPTQSENRRTTGRKSSTTSPPSQSRSPTSTKVATVASQETTDQPEHAIFITDPVPKKTELIHKTNGNEAASKTEQADDESTGTTTESSTSVSMATKEPPRQLRSMAASPSRRSSFSRSRTSSTASSSTEAKETPKTRSTRSAAKSEVAFKPGALVWVKWSDARPYGAVVISYKEQSQMYTVRFGYDGLEVKRKPEHVLDTWVPGENMNDTFGKYFTQLFKKSDSKQIQKSLLATKRQYDAAYDKHLKEQAQKEEPKVLLQNVVTKLDQQKKVKKKSLSDLAHQLTTKAASQQELQQAEKETTSSVVQVLEKRSRKAPPSRRASTTITPERRTRQSTPPGVVEPHLEPRMMPKSVKDSLMKKETPPSSTSINTVKLSAFAHSPRKTPPMSPLLTPNQTTTPTTSHSPILSPRQTRPAFEIGNRVKILTAGNAATVEKVLAMKNRPYEYMIRVENGPRYKLPESELSKMSASEYIVKPLVDQLVNDIVMRHERKQREAKKLEPTGLKPVVNSPPPVYAFTGVENQYKCPGEQCTKSFRKERGLEAHIKHYHPSLNYSPVSTPKSTPKTTPRRTPKIKTPSPLKPRSHLPSESEDDNVSVVSAASVPKSEQSIDEIDTFTQSRSVTYQCSCGWEGAEFWSQNPSGVPLRNHICQRPQKARNMKETQIMREIYRTVDMGDYYDGFKLQVFPDPAAQEMVREVNLVQNEIEQRVLQPCKKIRDKLKAIRPQIEQMSNTTPDDSVSFSVAEGVSTAQNAFPDTYADKKNDYSEQELTLLKTVDANDQMLMDTFKENSQCEKMLDEFEQYIEFMERDLDKKLISDQRLPEVQLTLNE